VRIRWILQAALWFVVTISVFCTAWIVALHQTGVEVKAEILLQVFLCVFAGCIVEVIQIARTKPGSSRSFAVAFLAGVALTIINSRLNQSHDLISFFYLAFIPYVFGITAVAFPIADWAEFPELIHKKAQKEPEKIHD